MSERPCRSALVLLLVTGLGSCGGLPAWSADPADAPGLRARVASLPGDVETRLRLAGVLWRAGERQEARSVLSEGLSSNPGHPSLLALEARAAHVSGDHLTARTAYLEGAARSAGTALSDILARNATDVGPMSARGLAQLIVSGAGPVDHGGVPLQTVAIAPFSVPDGAARLESVGLALTEMLVYDLRRVGPFSVVDRSLTTEMVGFLGGLPEGQPARSAVTGMATLLNVGHVVWGALESTPDGGVTARISGLRLEGDGGPVISNTEIHVQGDDLSLLRARVAEATWMLMVGGSPGSNLREAIASSPPMTLNELAAFGEGVRLGDRLEHDAAARALTVLVGQIDDLEVARELTARERRLAEIAGGESLGLEAEAIALARQLRTVAALRSEPGLAPLRRAPSGNEMFGQDRLGFQHLADFIIRVGSGS